VAAVVVVVMMVKAAGVCARALAVTNDRVRNDDAR
jgi:hypothetical protein